MSQGDSLNRRAFLRQTGVAAIAGAASTAAPKAALATSAAPVPPGRYDFDAVYNRFGTDCVKYDQQIRMFGKGSVDIGMGVADMDFRVAPVVTRALQARLQHENWGYLDMTTAQEHVADAVVAWNKRRYGIDIDPLTIELAAGVHPALVSALQTFAPRGSRVLMQTPAYDGFYTDLKFTGTVAEESPLKLEGGRFSMDFDDFERRIGHDTNVFILCNPHNPTGNCWSAEDLLRIGEICLRRRVIVLADEIHCDWVTKGHKYTPFASLKNRAVVDNSLTFKAASKSFGLAAHKVAWFYSTNPDLLARVRANHRTDLSTLGIVANLAALNEGGEWLDQAVAYVEANHDFVQQFVADRLPLIKTTKPQGTYLSWLDVTAVEDRIDAKRLAAEGNRTKAPGDADVTPEKMVELFFVRNARVQLNAGSNYSKDGANHMRMNIATSRKLIEQALVSMERVLKSV